jgi:hypothetical protein
MLRISREVCLEVNIRNYWKRRQAINRAQNSALLSDEMDDRYD